MPRTKRRIDGLFDQIARFDALFFAARRAIKGKRRSPGAAAFMADLERNCIRLEQSLLSGAWTPGRYTVMLIKDPKPRRISAAPFRDRVVHHAVMHVVEPIFERGFIDQSFANRVGFGSHAGVDAYQRFANETRFVLRCDIYRYFPAIDHEILKSDLRRRIACAPTLNLLDRIIDGSNAQEPVNLHYPGDDLLTPLTRRRGLPIGNLTSQFFANVYLNPLDHFIKERLRCRRYVRYVDDFALFHDDRAQLEAWRAAISAFLDQRRLSLHPRKTNLAATSEPAAFLGYVTAPRGRRRLPDANVQRFRNRLRGLRDRWRMGAITAEAVRQRVDAWSAHAAFADTLSLRAALFGGGWFDPFLIRKSRRRAAFRRRWRRRHSPVCAPALASP